MKMKIISMIAVTLACALPARSQTTTNDDVLINGDNGTVNLMVTGNNGSLFTGTFGSGAIPATGAGTRMMWYPKKAAFRVGRVSYNEWDDANIGYYSFAAGVSPTAKGFGSIAMGDYAEATGEGSMAFGISASAPFPYSIAFGGGCAWGEGALTVGSAYAAGINSCAFGHGSTAYADRSTAIGACAVAMSYCSIALGMANVEDYSEDFSNWVATDTLIVVGNGIDNLNPSNALVIRKNADMRTGGTIEAREGMRAKPLGDLSMGPFTSGDNPSTLDARLKYSGE